MLLKMPNTKRLVAFLTAAPLPLHHNRQLRARLSSVRPLALVGCRSASRQFASLHATTTSTVTTSPSTFARGVTFSRRRIGLYELKRAGVDASVLLKRDFKFERIYLLIVVAFTSILFVIPVLTDTSYPEGPIAAVVSVIMSAYAVDTLGFRGILTQTLVAAFNDRTRVARHEAAHLVVAHLLGFHVADVALPLPGPTWRARREKGPAVGVTLARSFAEDDTHRVAATGLAGLAGELLYYGDAKGVESDLGQVSRSVRRLIDTVDRPAKAVDDEVKNIVRWGLLVAAQLIALHRDAFDAVVDGLLQGLDAKACTQLVDQLANHDGLVEEPFGTS